MRAIRSTDDFHIYTGVLTLYHFMQVHDLINYVLCRIIMLNAPVNLFKLYGVL